MGLCKIGKGRGVGWAEAERSVAAVYDGTGQEGKGRERVGQARSQRSVGKGKGCCKS